jgi:hypothetical protein
MGVPGVFVKQIAAVAAEDEAAGVVNGVAAHVGDEHPFLLPPDHIVVADQPGH